MAEDHITSNEDLRQLPAAPFLVPTVSDTPLASTDTASVSSLLSTTQSTSATVSPNMDLSKAATNQHLSKLLQKDLPISLADDSLLNSESSSNLKIPRYLYDNSRPADPLKFVEGHAEDGKKYGAIKLSLDSLHDHLSELYMHIDVNLFVVPLKNDYHSPTETNLLQQLAFYHQLIDLHTSRNIKESKSAEIQEEHHLKLDFPSELPTQKSSQKASIEQLQPSIPSTNASSIANLANGIQENFNSNNSPAQEHPPLVQSAISVKTELDVETDTNASTAEEQKFTSKSLDWSHIPLVEGKPLDLYKLYSIVSLKGGFTEVTLKNQWNEVLKELGLHKVESSSVVEAVCDSYHQILYPFEMEKKSSNGNPLTPPMSIDLPQTIKSEPSDLSIGNGHVDSTQYHSSSGNEIANKRQKLNSTVPLRLGPTDGFERSVRAKTSKGILLNSPHLIKVKPALIPAIEGHLPVPELSGQFEKQNPSIDPDTQLSNYLEWIATYMSDFTDSPDNQTPFDTECTLRQVIDEDNKYQCRLLESFVQSCSNSEIDIGRLEALFFDSLKDHSQPIRASTTIPYYVNQVDTNRIADKSSNLGAGSKMNDFLSTSNGLIISNGTCYANGETETGGLSHKLADLLQANDVEKLCNSDNQKESGSIISSAFHPFNLHNIPFLPNSLLGALNDNDLDSKHLTSVSLKIGHTFSVENWNCEDHFTQSCEYLIGGAWKRWFFIPELNFEKFQQLMERISDLEGDSLNDPRNNFESAQIEELLHHFVSDAASSLSIECLLKALSSVESNINEIRLNTNNSKLNQVIGLDGKKPLTNKRYLITPKLLEEHGIKFSSTIQKPGEVIFKYPKTYSFAINFGVNISEKVNFASNLWLDYGLEAEKWLALRHFLPNFLIFKLCLNLIHQLDSSAATTLHFEAGIYSKITLLYSEMLEKELDLRSSIRKRVKLKEVSLEEKLDSDMLCDVIFQYAYPGKIVISIGTSLISISLAIFIKYLDLVDQEKIPDLIKDAEAKVELHLFLSDEKLRGFRRLLQEYSMDFDAWQRKYDELNSSEEEVALRSYKTLLSEGQKISVALAGLNKDYLHLSSLGSDDPSGQVLITKVEEFEEQLAVLREFVDESTKIVEQCQAILALKHQQRIRNGGSAEPQADVQGDGGESLNLLVELCNKIPKLSFHAPEFEQVFEFRNEIESFDRTCRQLLSQDSVPMEDVKDMVSLGLSFGMNIPSLLFLVRLQSKLEWLKIFDTIITGGDPFVGKKEIFLLPDLEKFRADGLECLAASDLGKLTEVDQYIAVGHELDRTVQEYISANTVLNHIDLNKLDEIMADMEDRVKLSGRERLFVQLGTYLKLVDLKSQEAHIQFLQSFKNNSHSLFEVKQTLLELKSAPFEVDTEDITSAIGESEAWLLSVASAIDDIKVRRSTSVTIKQLCDPKVASKLKTLVENYKVVCADLTTDALQMSSPYMFYYPSETLLENQLVIRYCLCRDFEDGAMIECDRCHEWFHFNCVSHLSVISENENEKYSCPACLVLESFKVTLSPPEIPEKLLENQLSELIKIGEGLRVQPVAELNILKELAKAVEDFKVWAASPLQIESSPVAVILLDELMCRKAVGAPVTSKDILDKYLRLLLNAVKPPPPEEQLVDPELKTTMEKTEKTPIDEAPIHKTSINGTTLQALIGQTATSQAQLEANQATTAATEVVESLRQSDSSTQTNGFYKKTIVENSSSSESTKTNSKDDDVTISEESSIGENSLEESKDIGATGNSSSYILEPDGTSFIKNDDTDLTGANEIIHDDDASIQNIDPQFIGVTAVAETPEVKLETSISNGVADSQTNISISDSGEPIVSAAQSSKSPELQGAQ